MRKMGALAIAIALATTLAPAAHAQTLRSAYCGEVTWQGQAPEDTWIMMLNEDRWTSPPRQGPLSAAPTGLRTVNGAHITMRSNDAPNFNISAVLTDERIIGEITAADGRRGVITLTHMRPLNREVSSSSVPPSFVVEAAQRALAGDMEGLNQAFSWGWTPQGSAYWRTIAQSGALPDHARAAITDWLRRARAGERATCDAQ